MDYKYSSDNLDIRGFIDKNKILEYVSEKQIYALVFGFEPEEYQYVTSPLRPDNNAGCWFETTEHGLVFRDFGKGNKPLDCFNIVQQYYNLPNFYKTLEFIYSNLIDGHNLNKRKIVKPIYSKEFVRVQCASRNFIKADKMFWIQFEISKQNLIDDKVFPVSSVYLSNTKTGDVAYKVKELCYAFTNFRDGRKKLYFPNRESGSKFINGCLKDDIGGVDTLPPFGRILIITKSYKDWRVLKNQGKNVIWIQNEGMIPSVDSLIPIVKRFDKVFVFYDNDTQGIRASIKMCEFINSFFSKKAFSMHLPIQLNSIGISDPGDMIKIYNKRKLNNFLNTNIK
jgi:hypothetical protein